MTEAYLSPETLRPRRRIVDEYLALLAAEYGRNTARRTASHLHCFFAEVDKEPDDVGTADVLAFLRRQGPHGERRLRSVIGLFAYIEFGTITDPRDDVTWPSERK